MARPKKQEAAEQKVEKGIPAGHADTLVETSTDEKFKQIQEGYTDERDLANQLFGQAQAFRAVSQFTTVVSLTKLLHVKESKLYRGFAGKTIIGLDGQESRLVGTWAEYCELLGTSASKVDEDLTNLKAFGEDSLEQLNRIGAGYRELRKLRKLPEDQQTALIEVAKLGDKESFIELAEEIITKHAKEKEALIKRAENAEGDLESSRQRGGVKEKEIEKLTGEVAKLKRRIETETPDEAAKALCKEAGLVAFDAEHAINKNLRKALQELTDHAAENGGNHAEFMLGLVTQVEYATNQLRAEFGLLKAKPDGEITPDWMRDDVQEQLRADAEKLKPEWMKELEKKSA